MAREAKIRIDGPSLRVVDQEASLTRFGFSIPFFEHPGDIRKLEALGYLLWSFDLLFTMFNYHHYPDLQSKDAYLWYLRGMHVMYSVLMILQLLSNSYHAMRRRLNRSLFTLRMFITLMGFLFYSTYLFLFCRARGLLTLEDLAARLSSIILFNSAYELLFLSTKRVSVVFAALRVLVLGSLCLAQLVRPGTYFGYGVGLVAAATGIESYFLRANTRKEAWSRRIHMKVMLGLLVIALAFVMQYYTGFFVLRGRTMQREELHNIDSTFDLFSGKWPEYWKEVRETQMKKPLPKGFEEWWERNFPTYGRETTAPTY
jgi:hypothetical protein